MGAPQEFYGRIPGRCLSCGFFFGLRGSGLYKQTLKMRVVLLWISRYNKKVT